MKKKHFTIVAILVSLLFIAISNFNYIFAYSELSSNIWSGAARVSNSGIAATIINPIQWIGVAIIVGATIYKGIKFMTASPDGKAEIKKEIIMLVIGAVLVIAVGQILRIIFDLVLGADLY